MIVKIMMDIQQKLNQQQQQHVQNKNEKNENTLERSPSQPQTPLHSIVEKLQRSNTPPPTLATPNDIPVDTPNVKELGKVFETNQQRHQTQQHSIIKNSFAKKFFTTSSTSSTKEPVSKQIPESFYIQANKEDKQVPPASPSTSSPPLLSTHSKSNSDDSLIQHSISISSATTTTTNDNTPLISPRSNRHAGDWKDKTLFTQGSVANLVDSGRKKLLIGQRDTPPSSPSTQSPPNTSLTNSPVLSSSPQSESFENDIKYLEKKFNLRQQQQQQGGNTARKSILTKQDAEWIVKNFQDSPSTITPTTSNGNTLTSSLSLSNYRDSVRTGKLKIANDPVSPVLQPTDTNVSSTPITNTNSQQDDTEIDIYESPCFRFIEEAGKKKSISAESCRRPGIKTPLFLNVPTLAMPTQFHQTPPDRLSSNNFQVSVEENSSPDIALLFNQQIINRVAHDKELAYMFFPILKSSTKIQTGTGSGSQSSSIPHSGAIQTGVGANGKQSKGGIVGSANSSSNSLNGANGSSNDLYSLSLSPSSSPLSPSPPLHLELPTPPTPTPPTPTTSETKTSTPVKESNRKSYFPSIKNAIKMSTGSGNNSSNNSSTSPTQPIPSSVASSFSSSTSTPPLSPQLNSPGTLESFNSTDNSEQTNNNKDQQQTSTNTPVPAHVPIQPQIADISKIISDEFKDRKDMIFCQFSNIRNRYKLKSASLDGLIEILTHHKFSEPDFIDTFIITYKTFTTAQVVLSKLIEKYEYDPFVEFQQLHGGANTDSLLSIPEPTLEMEEKVKNSRTVKLRVVSILKIWIDKHFYDFERNEMVLLDIIAFIEGPLVEDGMEKVSENILKLIERKKQQQLNPTSVITSDSTNNNNNNNSNNNISLLTSNSNSSTNLISDDNLSNSITNNNNNNNNQTLIQFKVPPPILPQILKSDQIISIQNFDDLEIARQLTLIEHESYSLIKHRECLGLAFSKAGKEENAINIVNIIKRSNLIPLWVATEIVQEERLTKRSNIIKKFINIADHCRNLNNFNAVMEILSGLNLTPVFRLKKTWETLPRKYLATFKHLNSLMAPKNNFKVYREVLHTKNPPCLPFLGLYLTDMTFIEEATPDLIDNGLINMVKRSHLATVIKEIQQFQKVPYSFTPVPIIRDYLLQINGLQERALYKQSKIIEP
ncbi:RasGEF domain-containing protein [Tieghemostelium lacteum]|uniref:RasGEF domain-containing protein n=1 Tax=Tieghemostelium lacteum TaxID=361077 RepID=A0A152A2K5_TIELA|nr:RasGEF domain-containing protein [Tieghemostelium lacteum]|eukprot:KYR00468.1 RasGEF domain-containing protein [Tieghemostelium lacteum]